MPVNEQVHASDPGAQVREPRALMLGLGWFPDTLGGLDRYYRALFEQLERARGVVIGPAADAPARLLAVSRQDAALPRRLAAYVAAARRSEGAAELLDCHFALYAAAPLALGVGRRLPKVFHFQGPWAEESVSAGDSSRWRLLARRALERRTLRRADAHVVLSSAFRRVLVECYRVAPWDVHVLAPGVDLDAFSPGGRDAARARLGLGADALAAVCVRRLVPRMGMDVLLDAWGEALAHLPTGSQLLIAGEGPLREDLQRRAAEAALRGSVRLLGRIADPELVEIYRACDVAVVPSVAFEGFGLVVLEAAACGTPSIVTAVGGLPEAVRELDATLVVAPDDPGALARRLRAAAGGELPARALTREHAERNSWPAVAERHRVLYRALAQRRRDPRPRVVYLDHVARLSGGEIALLRVLPHMQRVNAHVLLGEDGPLAERLQQAGVSVEVLPIGASLRDLRRERVRPLGAPLAPLQTGAYVARLARRLRQLRPDLVHSNSLKAGVLGSLAARAAGVPLLWHLRDRVARDYLPAPAALAVRAMIGGLAGGVVANSQATLDTLGAARAGTPRWVIPDSVELPPQRPRGALDGAAPVRFAMLGRIAPWKGQDLFLRAFAQAFPGGPERAVIVGTPLFGEQDYERTLHELAEQGELAGRVEFRGFREDIWSELARVDVLVHASVIPEPFGQVVLEGMAAGLPVLAPDEGGPAAVIDDGRTGRLFASRDAGALAAGMRALRDDASERARLGDAARIAAEAYHPALIAARLQDAYASLLGTARERPA